MKSAQSNEKIYNIQALRGVAAIAVLLAHLGGAERDYGNPIRIIPGWFEIGVSGVDLFFLISGFVMIHVAGNNSKPAQKPSHFLFNRAARIYPLYWVMTLAILVLYAGKAFFFAEATPLNNIIASFLLLPSNHLPILNVGWTLVYEMYFYLIFAGFIWVSVKHLPIMLSVWSALLLVANIGGLVDLNAVTAVVFSPLTFEFIAGCLIAMLLQRHFTEHAWKALFTGIAIFALLATGLITPLNEALYANFDRRILFFGPPFALILYGAVAMEMRSQRKAPAWLIKAGDISYALYLVHIPVFLVVGKTLSLIQIGGALHNLLIITISPIVAISVAVIAHKWIEKPALRYTKKLGARLFKTPRSQALSAKNAA